MVHWIYVITVSLWQRLVVQMLVRCYGWMRTFDLNFFPVHLRGWQRPDRLPSDAIKNSLPECHLSLQEFGRLLWRAREVLRLSRWVHDLRWPRNDSAQQTFHLLSVARRLPSKITQTNNNISNNISMNNNNNFVSWESCRLFLWLFFLWLALAWQVLSLTGYFLYWFFYDWFFVTGSFCDWFLLWPVCLTGFVASSQQVGSHGLWVLRRQCRSFANWRHCSAGHWSTGTGLWAGDWSSLLPIDLQLSSRMTNWSRMTYPFLVALTVGVVP